MINDTALTVSQLNMYVKMMFESDYRLNRVVIVGEISNFVNHYKTGHCYFSLKDENSCIKAVMFARSAQNLKFRPENGMRVFVTGRVSVFERDGVYQIYAESMEPEGAGALMLAFEQLKSKLAADGVFDDDLKQPIPDYPEKIAVVTSPVGAAVQDVINVLSRRYPLAEIILCPVAAQGVNCAQENINIIRLLNQKSAADVIILCRGGGSIEELWAFNEEATVRAVAASAIPVISAVGHETDFTLCDFAADVRAATPSQAAELAVVMVENLSRRCRQIMNARLEQEEYKLDRLANSWALKEPDRLYADGALRTDAAYNKLLTKMDSLLKQCTHKFELQAARLDNLSPLSVLARGYSVTQKDNFKVVTSTQQVRWGEELVTTVADGKIVSVVQSVEEA